MRPEAAACGQSGSTGHADATAGGVGCQPCGLETSFDLRYNRSICCLSDLAGSRGFEFSGDADLGAGEKPGHGAQVSCFVDGRLERGGVETG
jgi:hypothetical protein